MRLCGFVAELAEESGVPIDFALCGSQPPAIFARRRAGCNRRRDPRRTVAGRFVYPGDAYVDPNDMLRALRRACSTRGVEIVERRARFGNRCGRRISCCGDLGGSVVVANPGDPRRARCRPSASRTGEGPPDRFRPGSPQDRCCAAATITFCSARADSPSPVRPKNMPVSTGRWIPRYATGFSSARPRCSLRWPINFPVHDGSDSVHIRLKVPYPACGRHQCLAGLRALPQRNPADSADREQDCGPDHRVTR